MVFKGNNRVALALIDIEIAEHELTASKFPLDYNFSFSLYNNTDKTNPNSSIENTVLKTSDNGISFGITKKFTYGTEIELSFQSIDKASDSPNALADSWNQSALFFKLTQPLLKGRAAEYNVKEKIKSPIKISRYKEKLYGTYSKELTKAVSSFLKIIQLDGEIVLKEDLIYYYKKQQKYFKKSLKLGSKSKVKYAEVTASFEREKALKLKKEKYRNDKVLKVIKSLGLSKAFLNGEKFTFNNNLKDSFIDKVKVEFKDINLIKVKEMAYRELETIIDNKYRENSVAPTLDLGLEFLSSGLATDRGDSFKNITQNDFPSFEISLNFIWALGSNASRGQSISSQALNAKRKLEAYDEKRKIQKEFVQFKEQLGSYNVLAEKQNDRLKNQKELLNIRKKFYRHGKISILELDDAINDFYKIETEVNKNRLDRLNRRSKIIDKTGGYKQYLDKNLKTKA
jgi:hypothetical protein